MIFNPLTGRIEMDNDEIQILECALRKCGVFLRENTYYLLRHMLWVRGLQLEYIPVATKILRLWNVEAQYRYANKMVKELEELATHAPEWEENLKKMLAREKKDVGNQHPDRNL